MAGNSHQHISDHLSELVENTCQELSQAKLIEVEGAEEMVRPTGAANCADARRTSPRSTSA